VNIKGELTIKVKVTVKDYRSGAEGAEKGKRQFRDVDAIVASCCAASSAPTEVRSDMVKIRAGKRDGVTPARRKAKGHSQEWLCHEKQDCGTSSHR
jgi:hypothetical protein